MARPTSISILSKGLALALLVPFLAFGGDYKCEEAEFVSRSKQKDKVDTCFHEKNPRYFISNNCVDFSCEFTKKIKTAKIEYTQRFRPGVDMCRALGGGVEFGTIKRVGEVERCVFPDDLSSISIDLLESWDGKIFAGPGKVSKLFDN